MKKPKTEPFISVIIPTRERGKLLIDTIDALLKNDYTNFEIIAVDQTKRPAPEVIDYFKKNLGKVRHIWIEKEGLPNARNVGISHARGDVLLFLDDDIIPGKRLLSSHARWYRDETIDGLGGKIIRPERPPRRMIKNPRRIAKIRFGGLILSDNLDADISADVDYVGGGNMSFRREVFDTVGTFDIRYGGHSHLEETDFSVRAKKHGFHLRFEPKASLVHLAEPSGGCRPKSEKEWFFWYGHNLCLFYKKNFPSFFFPGYLLFIFIKLLFSAARRWNVRVLAWGTQGMIHCMKRTMRSR